MFRRSMVGLSVEDVEKRRLPSKHYVYVIYVTWNDGSLNIIYRRYSRFFELQTKLLDKFPEEAGSKDPTRRIIPFLPGKILFGRSHIREVALKRLESINQYCKTLIKLPAHISECDEVLAFFETSPDDLLQHSKTIERKPSERKGKQISHPLLLDQYVATADYDKMGRNEVSLQTGMRVEVVEKTEVGWWFVSTDEGQGWVPSSHLEKEDGSQENRIVHEASPGEEERFVVVETYIPMAADEIRIDKGGFVQVIERNLDGWWLVRYQGNEGRVPATNLTQADTLKMSRVTSHVTAPPVEVIPNLMSISTFNQKKLDRLVSATSSKEGRGDRQRNTPESPTKPLIDFDSPPSSAKGEQSRQGIDENFNPLLRNSRRKCPPPRRNSVSTERNKKKVAPPRPAPPAVEAVYVAIADLSVTVEDGVSLQRGQVVSVLEKTETGWWYVSAGGDRGWAPVSYITKRHQAKKAQSASPRPPRPNPPPGKAMSGSGAAAATHDSPSDGLASLAAALQARCAKQQQSSVTVPDQTRQQEPQAAAAAAVGAGSDQLYQNVEDSEGTEVGRYVAAYPFEGVEVGEVRLSVGDIVDVLGRNVSGWWYVKVLEGYGQGEGWVPSNFLRQADEDAESNGSGVSGRLGSGVYAEVKNTLYDDLDSVWSDSSGSSPGPSPAHTAAPQPETRNEPVAAAKADSNIEHDMKEWSLMSDNATGPKTESSDGFSDIERLSNFVRSSFKGQRPALPLKQSKDAENSQQKMALETKPNIPYLKPVQNKSNSEESEVKWKNANQSSCIPSVSSLKPTASNKPVNSFKNPPKPATEDKPSLPVKKFSNGASKPFAPMSKPDVGAKPSIPCNKPNASIVTKPGVKPPVPGIKPPVKSMKPALPQNKPEDSRSKSQFTANKNLSTPRVNTASQVKPGTKLAWPPGQHGENTSTPSRQNDSTGFRKNLSSPPMTSASSSSVKPSKVQDLAKLFGQ